MQRELIFADFEHMRRLLEKFSRISSICDGRCKHMRRSLHRRRSLEEKEVRRKNVFEFNNPERAMFQEMLSDTRSRYVP